MTATPSLGALYNLLGKVFPGARTPRGKLDVHLVAASLGVSKQAMYQAFNKDFVSPSLAMRILLSAPDRDDRMEVLDMLEPLLPEEIRRESLI